MTDHTPQDEARAQELARVYLDLANVSQTLRMEREDHARTQQTAAGLQRELDDARAAHAELTQLLIRDTATIEQLREQLRESDGLYADLQQEHASVVGALNRAEAELERFRIFLEATREISHHFGLAAAAMEDAARAWRIHNLPGAEPEAPQEDGKLSLVLRFGSAVVAGLTRADRPEESDGAPAPDPEEESAPPADGPVLMTQDVIDYAPDGTVLPVRTVPAPAAYQPEPACQPGRHRWPEGHERSLGDRCLCGRWAYGVGANQ